MASPQQLHAAHMNSLCEPVNARAELSRLLRARLCAWLGFVHDAPGFSVPDRDRWFYPKAAAALAVYDDALAKLEGKTCPRAASAREMLTAARAPLAAGRDLADSLGPNLDQSLALELGERMTAARAALRAAIVAKETATRPTVGSALLEIEKCFCDLKAVDLDVDSINERLILPPLPSIEELESAAANTRALESVKRPKAADVHAAIEQGVKAPAHVGALWIAYETQPDNELVKWRWRGHTGT